MLGPKRGNYPDYVDYLGNSLISRVTENRVKGTIRTITWTGLYDTDIAVTVSNCGYVTGSGENQQYQYVNLNVSNGNSESREIWGVPRY